MIERVQCPSCLAVYRVVDERRPKCDRSLCEVPGCRMPFQHAMQGKGRSTPSYLYVLRRNAEGLRPYAL